jgi:hypothetical protein
MIAVLSQSGPFMTASTRRVTYRWPAAGVAGACSECSSSGTAQDTDGSRPWRAAVRKCETSSTLPTWPSRRTVVNAGSGFQISGVEDQTGSGGWPLCM